MGRERLMRVAVATAVATALGVLWGFDPQESGLFPPCPFRVLTGGWYCPGCGSLRSMHALLHGEWARAFAWNPLLVIALPALGFGFLRGLMGRGQPSRDGPAPALQSPWVPRAVLGILVGYALLRNLPWGPLAVLAPHDVP